MIQNEISRRDFLRKSAVGGATLALSLYGVSMAAAQAPGEVNESLFKTINRAKNPAKLEGLERGHVPVITAPDTMMAGQPFEVEVQVGEKMHEMLPLHYIDWVDLYANEVFLTKVILTPKFTEARFKVQVVLSESATLRAIEHCNLHGLWEGTKKVQIHS